MQEAGQMEHATLGGGCFWCLDGAYREVAGVSEVVSGYAAGHLPHPTYEQVCGKKTGHAEVVRVGFAPAVVSYADLLRMFDGVVHRRRALDRRDTGTGCRLPDDDGNGAERQRNKPV